MRIIARLLLVLALLSLPHDARSESVITYKTLAAVQVTGASLDPIVPVIVRVPNLTYYRALVFELDYARGGGGAALDVTMTCNSCRVSDVAAACLPAGAGLRELHIAVSTDPATGITLTKPATWRRTVSASSSWTWQIANLPSDTLYCSFLAASANAADTITIATRLVTP